MITNKSYKDLPFSVPKHVYWIAQDGSGAWWGYTVEPLRKDDGWYENEVGEYMHLGITVPDAWENSLLQVREAKAVA